MLLPILTSVVYIVNWREYSYRAYNADAFTRPTRGPYMIRLRVAELLETRGETAYALAMGAGLTLPRAYRLARSDGRFERIEAEALDALCRHFGVQPGDLLVYVPDGPRGGAKRSTRTRRKSS